MDTATRKKKSETPKLKQPKRGGGKTPKLYRPPGSFPFPPVRGKILADAYMTTEGDLNCVTLRFNDNTELIVDLEPCLRFAASYSDWKTGDQRIIKRWPRVRNRT
jgi:hypothetical protein